MRLSDATHALGSALVDAFGETVDFASHLDPFEMKVAAAEMRLLLQLLQTSEVPVWPETSEIVLRAGERSFAAIALPEGYSIVMILPRHTFTVSRRALNEATRDICFEAGMPLPRTTEHWSSVEVKAGRRRPWKPHSVWLNGAWRSVELIGRFAAIDTPSECAFRARLSSGAELTLVREPLGRWYADMLPA